MPAPYELIAGPFVVYWAPVGTPAPEISADPPSPWTLLGRNGAKNISEDGINIEFEETVEGQMVLGSTAVQKQFRTSEEVTLSMTILDVTAETFAFAMSNPSGITTSAPASGAGGHLDVPLLKGFTVLNAAFLMRGPSPYGDNWYAQYWLPRGYPAFSGALQYQKGEAAGIELSIMALENGNDGYGLYMAQNASPT